MLKGELLAVKLERDHLKEKAKQLESAAMNKEGELEMKYKKKQAELKALAKEREQRMQKIREARTGSSSSSNCGDWADDSESEAWYSACED